MADARSPIGAARDLVFPGHRLIQTPTRRCTPTPLGCTVFPRVIARARDTQDLGHHSDRVGSLGRVHQLTALILWCPDAKKALAFPKNSLSFSSSRTLRLGAVISASSSRGSGRPCAAAWRRSRSSVTHRPTTESPNPQSRATDAIKDPVSNTRLATSRRYSGVKRRRVPITSTSLAAGTRARLTKCQQHKPNPRGIHAPTMKQPPSTPTIPHQQAEKSPQNQHVLSYNLQTASSLSRRTHKQRPQRNEAVTGTPATASSKKGIKAKSTQQAPRQPLPPRTRSRDYDRPRVSQHGQSRTRN